MRTKATLPLDRKRDRHKAHTHTLIHTHTSLGYLVNKREKQKDQVEWNERGISKRGKGKRGEKWRSTGFCSVRNLNSKQSHHLYYSLPTDFIL